MGNTCRSEAILLELCPMNHFELATGHEGSKGGSKTRTIDRPTGQGFDHRSQLRIPGALALCLLAQPRRVTTGSKPPPTSTPLQVARTLTVWTAADTSPSRTTFHDRARPSARTGGAWSLPRTHVSPPPPSHPAPSLVSTTRATLVGGMR